MFVFSGIVDHRDLHVLTHAFPTRRSSDIDHIPEGDPRGWQPIAPSAIPFGANLPRRPRAMTKEDIRRVQQDYVVAARRALAAGFDWLELHFAHGYLAQSFLSPHSNQRDDEYGGSLGNRSRFLIETLDAVRAVWPENRPLDRKSGVEGKRVSVR